MHDLRTGSETNRGDRTCFAEGNKPVTDQSERLRRQLEQLRFLAVETTDPLANRLVGDLIAELEETLAEHASPPFLAWAKLSSHRV